MRIAVIGCGYVGSAVANLWHRLGEDVTVTTTTPNKTEVLNTIASEVVVLDGNNLAGLKDLVTNKDVVLLSVGAKQRTLETYQQAYLATANNVMAAIRATGNVRQLIYTGSYGILGNQKNTIVDETAIPNPRSEFGEILAKTERVLLSSPSEFKTCILRLSGIYGPGRELTKIYSRVAGTTRPGKGEDYTNWVHLDDIVGAIDFAKRKQLHGIYNLASEVMTTKEFFTKLFETHNLPNVIWDESQPSNRSYNMKLSSQKIKDTGYEFIHPKIEFN